MRRNNLKLSPYSLFLPVAFLHPLWIGNPSYHKDSSCRVAPLSTLQTVYAIYGQICIMYKWIIIINHSESWEIPSDAQWKRIFHLVVSNLSHNFTLESLIYQAQTTVCYYIQPPMDPAIHPTLFIPSSSEWLHFYPHVPIHYITNSSRLCTSLLILVSFQILDYGTPTDDVDRWIRGKRTGQQRDWRHFSTWHPSTTHIWNFKFRLSLWYINK